jgi:hypothetical protein
LLSQRGAVAKQTAQVNRVTVAAVRSAWAAMLSGAALSYILSDASRYSQRPAVSLTLQLATACVRVNAPLDRSTC